MDGIGPIDLFERPVAPLCRVAGRIRRGADRGTGQRPHVGDESLTCGTSADVATPEIDLGIAGEVASPGCDRASAGVQRVRRYSG